MGRRAFRPGFRLPRDPRAAAVWLAAMLLLALLVRWRPTGQPPTEDETPARVTAIVKRVVDGDTLLLSDDERIRLIGADTPETVQKGYPVEPWGREATEFTSRFVAEGRIRLEFDGPRQDRYGRTLAHVWVGESLLSEELVRAGLATAETGYDYSEAMKARLKAAETEAQAAGRGIWSGGPPPTAGSL